jgi:TolB-like protein/tetratricopeptide (TPR) repeat protein
MTTLIVAAAVGFPVALAVTWFLQAGNRHSERDTAAAGVSRGAARGLRRYADAIVIGVLLATVATLLVRQSGLGRPKPPATPVIAVLPCQNSSEDPQQEYFSDGLAHELLDQLGQVPGLTVIARSSSFSFRGKDVDPRTIAERLGVTTLLECNARRTGDRLKLSVELSDGASGRVLWSGSFDRHMTDVFRVQEELAAAVIEAIVPTARGTPNGRPAVPSQELDAFDLYLLGRSAQETRGSRMPDAVAYLEQAVQADPDFAKAYAALSRALVLWTAYPYVPAPADALSRAEAAAYKALAVDSQSSEAHAALGTVLRHAQDKEGARRAYVRALEINPNNAVALWDYIVMLGNDLSTEHEAAQLSARLEKIDPRAPMLWQSRIFHAAKSPAGAETVRSEVAKATAVLADDADALRLVGLAARISGYAAEAYGVSLAIARTGNSDLALLTAIRAWLLVDDTDRARRTAAALLRTGDEELAGVAGFYLHEIAGLDADYSTWKQLDSKRTIPDADVPDHARFRAFWLAVQQRYAEAAVALAHGEPVPDDAIGGLGSSLLGNSQLLPALLRIYRNTGRADEANAIARRYLEKLRRDPDAGLDLAALAANEGLQDEAVRALESLFERYPLVDFFYPQLPWFKSLEGHPRYDRLLPERSRRIDAARKEMLQLEASADGTVLKLRQSPD